MNEDGQFEGLGDIVSNLMALFILLTIFVLVSQTEVVIDAQGQSGTGGQTSDRYSNNPADPLAGSAAYYIVSVHGVVGLSADILSRTFGESGQVLDAPETVNLPVSQVFQGGQPDNGATVSIALRARGRDVPFGYQVSIDQSALSENDFQDVAPTDLIAFLETTMEVGQDPTFVVLPSGADRFARYHSVLQDNNLCFRWAPWREDAAFMLRDTVFRGQRRCDVF